MRKALPGALLLCFSLSCGKGFTQSFAGLTRVTGASPLPAGCGGFAGHGGVNYPGAEVEPWLAVDPNNPSHFIATWQQDRWSNGGANGQGAAASFDGGRTWSTVFPHFTHCTGGTYERASDPWVTFAPDGAAYQITYAFDASGPDQAMLVSRTADGGRSWSEPLVLLADTSSDVADDKETITADPHNAGNVYAVWDRLTGLTVASNPQGTGPTWFARTLTAGASWEAARIIFDPGADAQTIGNQIAVLPDGTLLDLFTLITRNSSSNPGVSIAVLRSTDQGQSWQFYPVATEQFVNVTNPSNGHPVRTGNLIPAIAADPDTGAVYVVWEDGRFSGGQIDGIALSRSGDGGKTWSAPVQVNAAPQAHAFTAAVAVAHGAVGVGYYDLRDDGGGNGDALFAARFLATSTDQGRTFQDARLCAAFNLADTPDADGYFVGDYAGMVASGAGFAHLFALSNGAEPQDLTDVFFRPALPF